MVIFSYSLGRVMEVFSNGNIVSKTARNNHGRINRGATEFS